MTLAVDTDLPAFREIFLEHRPFVRRFLAKRLKNEACADEATQETFVRALRRLPSLRDPRQLRSWLVGIARRVCAEQRRAAQRRHVLTNSPVDSFADGVANPEKLLLDRESAAQVLSAVDALRRERRVALRLRIEEKGYADIAIHLGWSVAKVKTEIHRARLEIKAVLAMSLGVFAVVLAIGSRPASTPCLHASEPALCFESGIGPVAALESEHRACLMGSPLFVAKPSPNCAIE